MTTAYRRDELCPRLSTWASERAMKVVMRGLTIIFAAVLMATSGAAVASDVPPICPDRPSKSTGPCTVPQGKWQVETGLVDWSRDKSYGVTTDTISWGGTGIKYGVSSNA